MSTCKHTHLYARWPGGEAVWTKRGPRIRWYCQSCGKGLLFKPKAVKA